jgi:hypothetical protein
MPDLALEGAVCPPGPTPTQPTPALNTGCLGRDPSLEHRVCSPSSVRAQRQKPFAPLMGRGGPGAGAPPPHKDAKLAHAAAVAWARSTPPSRPSSRAETHPSGTPRGQPNSLCRRVQRTFPTSRRDAAATRPRRALRPCAFTGRRDSPRRRLAPWLEPRDWRLDALPCRSGALACATNEAR